MSNAERRLNFEVRIRITVEILIGKNLGTLYLVQFMVLHKVFSVLLLDTKNKIL
jgi:hypothetical protein